MEGASTSDTCVRPPKTMKRLPIPCSLVIAVAAAGGCAEPLVPLGANVDEEYVVVVDIPPSYGDALDLLFVVDNSETMGDKQPALEHSLQRLLSNLEFGRSGLPDLHVGVVSTDMGVGDNPVAGCDFAGDGGTLQNTPRLSGCSAPRDRYLSDYSDGLGRVTNYEAESLTSAFSCIAQLGTNGCGFEQPLEAMRKALDHSNPENNGFVRPGAALGIIFMTDEDDCSVFDNGMFAPELDGTGQVSKFRCFRNGVTCPGDDVRIAGEFTNCIAKSDSQFMPYVAEYASFLSDLKFDPEQIVVTGIIGDSELVEVEVDFDDQPQLVPACEDQDGAIAYPAVRLQQFLRASQFGGEISSLCQGQPLSALDTAARKLRKALGTSCVDGTLRDLDPDEPGLQYDCLVYDLAPDGTRTEIPECPEPNRVSASEVVPCYAIKTGPEECGDFPPQQLALQVWRGTWNAPQPAGTHTLGECLVADTEAL